VVDGQTAAVLATGLTGVFGGAFTAGFLARFFFKRYIEENDKKHYLAEQKQAYINQKLVEISGEVKDKLGGISTDLAVIKAMYGEFAALKAQILTDHDELIRLGEHNKKHIKDINNQHDKIRGIHSRLEETRTLISGLRRLDDE